MAKYAKKVDIRAHGSGNVGATNVSRVLGKGYGLLVFGLDFLKGLTPVTAATVFLPAHTQDISLPAWIGLAAIVGHIYTPFLGFKGGKGVATGAGVVCASFPLIFALAMGVWVVTFVSTRIVSISSLFAIVTLVVLSWVFSLSGWDRLFLGTLLVLGAWTHRANLLRLSQGAEKRF